MCYYFFTTTNGCQSNQTIAFAYLCIKYSGLHTLDWLMVKWKYNKSYIISKGGLRRDVGYSFNEKTSLSLSHFLGRYSLHAPVAFESKISTFKEMSTLFLIYLTEDKMSFPEYPQFVYFVCKPLVTRTY